MAFFFCASPANATDQLMTHSAFKIRTGQVGTPIIQSGGSVQSDPNHRNNIVGGSNDNGITAAAATGFEMYSFFASTATAAVSSGTGTTISVAPSCGGGGGGGASLPPPPPPSPHTAGAQAHFTGIQPAAAVTHQQQQQQQQQQHHHHHHQLNLHHHQQQQQQQQQQQSVSAAINCSVVRAIAAAASSPSTIAAVSTAQQTVVAATSNIGKMKEMPKLVKLAPHRSVDGSSLQQETKKRKRPIGKSHALITSKPLTIVAPTPIITTRNEDSGGAAKYTFTSQNNPGLVLKKKDSTVQCSQTTATKTGVSGNIPVGIAVARQRYTQSTSSTEIQRQRETTTTTVSMPEIIHQTPMQTMMLSYNDCSMTTGSTAGINRWPASGGCNIPQNTIGSQWSFQNTTLRAPALEQQPMQQQPVGYQLVQDQSGQFFLLPQNSITGLMTMPFDYCKSDTQNHQSNQGYTLIQQPPQQMATISPIINHHPQYTSIASSGSYLIQQVNSSNPPALINTHHQLTDSTTHQQPLLQLASPENQMIIFNQQQSAIVAQPLISHLQPSHPGLTIATQMQSGCQNHINDNIQTVSESVTVQTKLVQQSITEKSTISSHTEENVSISLDYCNTTVSKPEKDLKPDYCAPEPALETEAIVSHDASNQTDLQTEDETYHSMTEENKETDFTESVQDCMADGQPSTDGATQSVVLSIAENSATPDITGLELLLNSIEQFEKRNSSRQQDNSYQDIVMHKEESINTHMVDTNANTIEESEEKGVNKIDLLLLAEQFLETEKSSENSELSNVDNSFSNNHNPSEELQNHQFPPSTKPLEVTNTNDVARKVYTKKKLLLTKNENNILTKEKLQIYSKLDKTQQLTDYSDGKVLKRKISDSSSSSSGQVKRGPGRPKKVLKVVDSDNINSNNWHGIKEKRMKLECSTIMKHKTSNSSSSDLSPPVLEPWSPFSPRKVSTHTPPTLSPVSSMTKLSEVQKSSDDEKLPEKKIAKKRSTTSSTITSDDEFRSPLKKRKVGRPRKQLNLFDENKKKNFPQNHKKEKQAPSSSGFISSVGAIKVNKIETSSSGQYKIKPKLKAEVKMKHWDVEDEDDEIRDEDDILASPKYVCKKRQIADALHRMSSFSDNKPAVIPKKRKFSNVSLDSVDSLLDDEVLFTRRDKFPVRLLPMNRSQTSESEISLEQTTEERDSSSTTVELVEQQCTPVSPSRPSVELITTCDNDHERKRLKKKRKHRKHKHGHDELRTKHKHKHHKKHHKKHKKRKDSEPELSVSEPPTLSPQTPAEEVRIDDDDDDKSRENDSSEVDSSDVPAFLSDQQIWKWSGDSYKRPGRGGNKKTFYKSISRGDETISIGDCAVFLSSGRPDRPFIGKVDCMWETNMEKMQVKVFWFYHPEETASGFTGDLPYPGALFKSPHNDINDVQSIMNGCQVVSFEEFKTVVEKDPERLDAIYDNNDLFYLAGDYEPVMKMITFCDGVTATSSDKI